MRESNKVSYQTLPKNNRVYAWNKHEIYIYFYATHSRSQKTYGMQFFFQCQKIHSSFNPRMPVVLGWKNFQFILWLHQNEATICKCLIIIFLKCTFKTRILLFNFKNFHLFSYPLFWVMHNSFSYSVCVCVLQLSCEV